jgi:predicted GIY-YIG superfamily endonuclease
LNGVNIIARQVDGYINATELCKAGGKEFSNWYKLNGTKELINELEKQLSKSDNGIRRSNFENIKKELIDIKKGGISNEQGSWIHPDLAVQLAQWISPEFAIKVSRWIRELMLTGKVELKNEKSNYELENIYKEKINNLENELEIKTNRLKQFEITVFNNNTDYCPIEYYEKDILYFIKFDIPEELKDDYVLKYPNIENKNYNCIEFGVSSDIESRLKSHKRDKKKENIIFLYAIQLEKRHLASKMESYMKRISKQLKIDFDYEKRKECCIMNQYDFNLVIKKITAGINNIDDINQSEYIEEYKEENYSEQNIEIHKVNKIAEIEIKKIENERHKGVKKIDSITDLLKNKIITIEEYKDLLIML